MSLFNRKTFLDGGFSSSKVNAVDLGIDFSDPTSVVTLGLTSTGEITGADDAAEAQKAASAESANLLSKGAVDANDALTTSYTDAKGYLDPYAEGGLNAYKQYMENLGSAPTWNDYLDPTNVDPGAFSYTGGLDPGAFEFDESQVTLDEGYLFRQREGQKELERLLSSMGMNSSGMAVKEGVRFNQGHASNEWDSAWNREWDTQAGEYDSLLGEYNRDYGRATDAYGTGVDAYNRRYGENMDAYNVDYGGWQDMMTRLGGAASKGMNVSGSLADLAMNYGYGTGNNIMTGAGAKASNAMNQGNIGANLATSDWSAMTDIAGLAVQAYTAGQYGGGGGGNNWWGGGGSGGYDYNPDDPWNNGNG